MTITIVIADDHVLFRQGLAMLLREHEDWQIVGEASDGEAAVRLAAELKPDIAVLDVEMPRMDGVDAACLIRRASPDTRIIAVSMYGDTHYQERMFQAGAVGYVLKNEAIDDLVGAIRAAQRGESFVSPAIVRRVSAVPLRSAALDTETLSARERDVLRLLAEGKRTKEIADILRVSPKTVETYRSRISIKLGIDTLPGLVKFAIRAGLISPHS